MNTQMRRVNARPLVLSVGVLVGLALLGSEALAKKRIVVLPFSGRGGATARGGFVRGLKRRVRFVSYKRYRRTADRLGVNGRVAAGIVPLCSKLRCHAVVRGSVRRRRRRYTVTATVYNGATGRAIGRRAATVRGRRRLRRAGAAIARACRRLISKGSYKRKVRKPIPVRKVDPPDQPPPKPTPPVRRDPDLDGALAKRDRDRDRDRDRARDRDRDRDYDRDRDRDDDGGRVSRRRRGKYEGLFDIGASIGLSTRTFELVVPQDGSKDRKYDGGMFPEFTLALEAYPLVLLTRGIARGIGLGVSYTRHISISTKLKTTNAPPAGDNAVDTTSDELMFNARFRWAIKDDLAGPVVYGFFGFGIRGFSLAQNVVLTSVSYQFLHLGAGGRIPLGSPFISLRAEASIRPLLKVGQEAVDSFGERSGGFAWSIRAGAYGRLKNGLFYFGTFEYLSFSMTFNGLNPADVRAGTADLALPSEGSDSFLRFWVGAGYAL